ncbi:putative membrane protein, partial [Vibrio parahaemolyticus AQ3810]
MDIVWTDDDARH